MIHQSTIDEINTAVRIEDVVGEFVTLTKKGVNYTACCPFHDEKTPSFNVNPARNIYKCFGCGKGGDAITFLIEQQGKTYPEALRWLASRYKIEVQETLQKPEPDHDAKTQQRATATVLQAHFALSAVDETPGRRYWLDRGFKPETLDEFGIGWCAGDKPAHVADEALRAIGATNEKGNLLFYKRTTIPIHDRSGRVVGWAGRSLETAKDIAKYINSPETLIYQKARTLFNVHRAAGHIRQAQEVWVVEGYADAIALWQVGVKNAVAISGTALTDQQAAELKKFNGERPLRFILCFDNEINQGTDTFKKQVAKAYQTALEKLLPIGEVKVIKYPKQCKDMGDVVQRGIEPQSLEKKDAIIDYVEANYSKEWRDNASPVEKADFQDTVAKMLAEVRKDNVRAIYGNQLATMLEISPRDMDKRVKEFRTEQDTEEKNRKVSEYRYIKVADEYYQRLVEHDIFTKSNTVVYRRRKRQELATEGVSVTSIPRFHDFICMPSNTNYQRTLDIEHEDEKFRFFNSYQPLPYKPKEFELPAGFIKDPENFDYEQIPEIRHTAAFMKHIFDWKGHRNRYLKIGWDWVTLCYLQPTQRLQALALVSSEEGTGKSTFINLMLAIFGQNATKTEASRIGGNFNMMSGGKVLQCVEETKDERGDIENKLKDLITAHEKVVEAKHQDARVVKSFDKYIFCSNHEEGFMKVGTQTTRFFIMKVHPIANKVPDFEEKMYLEIPYLLYFMQKRGVMTPKDDRLWFNPRLLENEALLKLRHASKDQVQQVMEELFASLFLRCELTRPILYISSHYLKLLMCSYGGKSYEQKTPIYFLNTATKDMRLPYKDAPVTREIIELNGIHADNWINNVQWLYEVKRSKSRFIEVPIWKYVSPADIIENYTPARIKELIEQLETAGVYSEAADWLEALKQSLEDMARIKELREPILEDTPF